MEFQEVLQNRHAIRNFDSKEIPEETIREIIELAELAPSAGNIQAYTVVVVRSAGNRKKLHETVGQDPLMTAPVSFIVCGNGKESAAKYEDRGKNLYAVQDATIFAAYLQLVITSQGLASVWMGGFDEEALKKSFDLPEELRPICIIPMGYPAGEPRPRVRKSVNEVIYKTM